VTAYSLDYPYSEAVVALKCYRGAVGEESQQPRTDQQSSNPTFSDQGEYGYRDNSNVPKLSYFKRFWFFFYNFGHFA